jgi:hypothetical protein
MKVFKDILDEDEPDLGTDSFEVVEPALFPNVLSFEAKQVRVDCDDNIITDEDYADMDDEGKALCKQTFDFARASQLIPAELKSANTYVKLMKKYIKNLLGKVYTEKGPKKKAFREAATAAFNEGGLVHYIKENFDEFEFYHVDELFGALSGEGMLVLLQWVGGTKPTFHIYDFGVKVVKV